MAEPPAPANPLGQPVGAPVPGWTPRARPGDAPLVGRACRVERLELPRHLGDLHAAFAAGGAALWTYLGVGPFATPDALGRWLAGLAADPDPWVYAVVDAESGAAAGILAFLRIAPEAGAIEIGWVAFAPALQGTTAATEAIALMLRHAFDDLGYRRVEWKCDALNAGSHRAARRLGFTFEGTHRQAQVVRGRNRDTAWYSILDVEWPRVAAALDAWLDPANFDAAGRQRTRLRAGAGAGAGTAG